MTTDPDPVTPDPDPMMPDPDPMPPMPPVPDTERLASLSANQLTVGSVLVNSLLDGSASSGLSALGFAIGGLTEVSALRAAFDELLPEIANANLDAARARQGDFQNLFFGQSQPQGTDEPSEFALSSAAYPAVHIGASRSTPVSASGPRVWGSVSYDRHRNSNTTSNAGYKSDGLSYTVGVANLGSGSWQFGIAGSYSDYDTTGLRGVRDKGSSRLIQFGAHAGTGFKDGGIGVDGRFDLVATYGDIKNDIAMVTAGNFPGLGSAQSGTADSTTYGATLRFTLDGSGGKIWPMQPFVSVGYDHISQGSVNLAGAGAANLAIESTSLDRYTLGYGLRFQKQWDKAAVRLGVAGYHYLGDTQTSLTSRFAELGANSPAFTTLGHDIKDQVKLDAGASYNFGSGWSASADAHLGFGDIQSYGGRFTLSKRF